MCEIRFASTGVICGNLYPVCKNYGVVCYFCGLAVIRCVVLNHVLSFLSSHCCVW